MMRKRYTKAVIAIASLAAMLATLIVARWTLESRLGQALAGADHENIDFFLATGSAIGVTCDAELARRYLMSSFGEHPWERLARIRVMAAMSGNEDLFHAVVWNMAHPCGSVADVARSIGKIMAEDGLAHPTMFDVLWTMMAAPPEVSAPVIMAWIKTGGIKRCW